MAACPRRDPCLSLAPISIACGRLNKHGSTFWSVQLGAERLKMFSGVDSDAKIFLGGDYYKKAGDGVSGFQCKSLF
jgi:hypothetical protein